MEHDIALLTLTLVACVPASSGQKSPDDEACSTKVRTLPGRTAAHAWRTALFSSATVEGGSSMSRIQTDIWSQTCSVRFMSGLASQSMTSTSCWSKKAAVSRAVLGAGHCLGCTQSYVQTSPSPMATFDSSGTGCTDAGSWLHPPLPAHPTAPISALRRSGHP